MNRNVLTRAVVVLLALLATGACDDDDVGLDLTIDANRMSTSFGEPLILTVRAVNNGSARIVWGRGSSSCQLHALVGVAGRHFQVVEDRACTEDLVEQGLDAGESRTELIPWDGRYLNADGDPVPMPTGPHDVRGAAGNVARSSAITVQVNPIP